MWRLLPLLAVLGFLEVLVPWPDVATLVLSNAHQGARRVVSTPMAASSVDMRYDWSHLLVQARDASR